MSDNFYDYVAKRIVEFFESKKDQIEPGSRYSLKLDNLEMVDRVDSSLINFTKKKGVYDEYKYSEEYTMSSFKYDRDHDMYVVIAVQKENMTNDFFTTLRNAQFTNHRYPILMITSTQNDSLISGTANLSAKGMPFNDESMIIDIKSKINHSSLKLYQKEILKHEIEKIEEDRYTDQKSLLEYQNIISAFEKSDIPDEDMHEFSLLPSVELKSLENKRKIIKKIKENENVFGIIDDAFKGNDLEIHLENQFTTKFINKLKDKKKKGNNWHSDLNLEEVLENRITKKSDQLEINDESLTFSSVVPNNLLEKDKDYYVRNDGETPSKARSKNILIFNPNQFDQIQFSFSTNKTLKKEDISFTTEICEIFKIGSKKCILKIRNDEDGIAFEDVKVSDPNSRVKYSFKICIINLPSFYFKDLLLRYTVVVKKRKKYIQLIKTEADDQFVFNAGQSKKRTEELHKISKNKLECKTDETVELHIDEDQCFNEEKDSIDFILTIKDIEIPISIKNETVGENKLNGIEILMKKMELKESLEFRNNFVNSKTNVYNLDQDILKYLKDEKYIIDEKGMYIEKEYNQCEKVELNVDEAVKRSYGSLINEIQKLNSLPSLVYYKEDSSLEKSAIQYLRAVEEQLDEIKDGEKLTLQQRNLLKIGLLKKDDKIYLTPLHPLNVLYQFQLVKEKGWQNVREDIVKKLNSLYLLPYIRYEQYDQRQNVYKAIEDSEAPEWNIYALENGERYNSSNEDIRKIVKEKIKQYKKHFSFLFETLGNLEIKINLVKMGDCGEVLYGLLDYLTDELKKGLDLSHTTRFTLNIYSEDRYNELNILSDHFLLRDLLEKLYKNKKVDLNELMITAGDNIHCYYHDLKDYLKDELEKYAHLTFYKMGSNKSTVDGTMSQTSTGLSLNGLLSDVPSVLINDRYSTGFGTKYADEEEPLVKLAKKYNAAMNAESGNSFNADRAINTQIENGQDELLNAIYKYSNWVVFVDPKVDLSFFKNSSTDELMIIHYSDQYASSSGYSDITVTAKSHEYQEIIKEQLDSESIEADTGDITRIISMFNAVNGSWLLNLISTEKTNSQSERNYRKEKMSILAAIKYCKAQFRHEKITWIPMSLEEILRVSGAIGLSKKGGLLSADNLHFDKGSTSDDILMLGVENINDQLLVYLHPVEVKIGQNNNTVIEKAKDQVRNTYNGLWNAFWPEDESKNDLEHKICRNFFIQMAIVSAEKMKLYDVDPKEDWNRILDRYRSKLLNDQFSFSKNMDQYIGKATIVSFSSSTGIKDQTKANDDIWIVTFPEHYGFSYMIKDIDNIYDDIKTNTKYSLLDIAYSRGYEKEEIKKTEDEENHSKGSERAKIIKEPDVPYDFSNHSMDQNGENDHSDSFTNEPIESIEESKYPEIQPTTMNIKFGTDLNTDQAVYWHPNDTDEVFHTNTGIIGTMGTGKTQFTKSLVTQLLFEKENNFRGDQLGILIFDYKGDYVDEQFREITNSKIYRPNNFEFNPFSMVKPKNFKPLLPIHVANAFTDTITKIYKLGPKQKNTLNKCILKAYKGKGIDAQDSSTWNRPAPTFNDVYNIYDHDDSIKKDDSLFAAMDKLFLFQIFESDSSKTSSLFDILKEGVVVINLAGFDDDIQTLVVAITLDLFYNQMESLGSSKMDQQYRQLTKFILVDEADNFMVKDFQSLKKILKEGREFGVGTILSTQFLSHFVTNADDYSKYIDTWIVHKVGDLKANEIDQIFDVSSRSAEEQKLLNDIRKLSKHQSIVKMGNQKIRYINDYPYWKLVENMKNNQE